MLLNRVLLVLYAIIVIVLLIVQIAGVALFGAFKSSLDSRFKETFKSVLETTYTSCDDTDTRNSFNALFKIFECCGVESAQDMPELDLPPECCVNNTETCTKQSGSILHQGCYTKLERQIANYSTMFIGIGVSILVFQLLCVIFAFCLCASQN